MREVAVAMEEGSSEAEQAPKDDQGIRVLKMLYKGNMAEVSRREETERKSRVVNSNHNFYTQTRVTSIAQE